MLKRFPDGDTLYGPYELSDPQQARVYCLCDICGGEIYSPGESRCEDCREKGGDD